MSRHGRIPCRLRPLPRTGAASSTNSRSSYRVSRGSTISSIQKASALRKDERSLFRPASLT